MTLQEALQTSDYSEATLVDPNGFRYSVDADGVVTSGVDGMPASIVERLPEEVAASDRWEAVGDADA